MYYIAYNKRNNCINKNSKSHIYAYFIPLLGLSYFLTNVAVTLQSKYNKIKYRVLCSVLQHGRRFPSDAPCLWDKLPPRKRDKDTACKPASCLICIHSNLHEYTHGPIDALMVLHCYYLIVYYCGILGYDIM